MLDFIFALVLLVVVLIAIELRKSYHALPKKELKYRASHGDPLAEKLYRAAAYDSTLDVFLWLVIILATAGSFVLFNKIAPSWLSFITIVLLLWIAFAWLPKSRVTGLTNRIVALVTPAVSTILNYLHPLVKRFYHYTKTNFEQVVHTTVYDKDDLSELISRQKKQPDNRISEQELQLIKNSLKLSETKVIDACLPWSKVVTVGSLESIGPILLDELHKSDQLFIPVIEGDERDNIIGVLNLTRLQIDSKGLVADSMDPTIYYLNERDTLDSALKAFAVTNYPMFIVVDDKQRLVGVLTYNNIIEQLVGHLPGTSFDQFSSISDAAGKYKTDDSNDSDKNDEDISL